MIKATIRLLFISFYGIWLIRCKKKADDQDLAKETNSSMPKKEVESKQIIEKPSAPANTADPYKTPMQTQQACFKNLVFPIDQIPDLPEELRVIYRFYCKGSWMILGYNIPHYRHIKTQINSIYLCKEDGELLAQKGFSTFRDLAEDESFKSAFFERKIKASDKKFFIVFVTSTQKSYKCAIERSKESEDTFLAKPIQSAGIPIQRPFVPKKERFYVSSQTAKLIVIADDQVENPQKLRDVIVTDIAGKVLSELGQDFNQMTKYSIFVCYKPIKDNYYEQSIIRL